jgi:hypothetical protein
VAQSFSCDFDGCDKDGLSRNEIIQVIVNISDPETGVQSDRKDFCVAHGDNVATRMSEVGFSFDN